MDGILLCARGGRQVAEELRAALIPQINSILNVWTKQKVDYPKKHPFNITLKLEKNLNKSVCSFKNKPNHFLNINLFIKQTIIQITFLDMTEIRSVNSQHFS